jgi:ferredoxin, 2Fe-2S
MEIIRNADLPMEAACGGNCSCGTCPVHVDPQWFEKLDPVETEECTVLLFTKYVKGGATRLSCQIIFTEKLDGIRVTLSSYED